MQWELGNGILAQDMQKLLALFLDDNNLKPTEVRTGFSARATAEPQAARTPGDLLFPDRKKGGPLKACARCCLASLSWRAAPQAFFILIAMLAFAVVGIVLFFTLFFEPWMRGVLVETTRTANLLCEVRPRLRLLIAAP